MQLTLHVISVTEFFHLQFRLVLIENISVSVIVMVKSAFQLQLQLHIFSVTVNY